MNYSHLLEGDLGYLTCKYLMLRDSLKLYSCCKKLYQSTQRKRIVQNSWVRIQFDGFPVKKLEYYDPKLLKLNIYTASDIQGITLCKLKGLQILYSQPLFQQFECPVESQHLQAIHHILQSDESDGSYHPDQVSETSSEALFVPTLRSIPHEFLIPLVAGLDYLKLDSFPPMHLDFLALVDVRKLELRSESCMPFNVNLIDHMLRLKEVMLSNFIVEYDKEEQVSWKTLVLQNCQLVFLTPLKSTTMQHICIHECYSEDIPFSLEYVPELESIKIQGLWMKFFWPTKPFMKVTKCSFCVMNVEGSVFLKLPGLTELDLYAVTMTGSDYLYSLSKLESLKWNDSDIPSEFRLQALPNLEIVHFNLSRLEDLKVIDGMEKLHTLNISFSSIKDYTIPKLKKLRHLIAEHNELADLSFLCGLELESLKLSFNAITDVTPLGEMRSLKLLDLSHNNLKSIAGLQNLVNLERLLLYMNDIEKLDGLEYLENLKELDISDNRLTVNDPVKSLRAWRKLRKVPTLPVPRPFTSFAI